MTATISTTAPEKDQDDAALADNAERIESDDWTPSVLPGNAPNATTNIGVGRIRIGGDSTGAMHREDANALAPVADLSRIVPEEPLTGDPGSTTGGVLNGRG